jgi:hypothetical protein
MHLLNTLLAQLHTLINPLECAENQQFVFHVTKYFDFCVNGWKSPLSVFNMIYYSALSIFIFKVGPLKVIIIWFINGSQTFKIPYNMISFHQIPKFYIDLTTKWEENCHKSCGLNVLRSWHIEIMKFVCIGGKVSGNVLKCCGILKYQKTQFLYHFLNIRANSDPIAHVPWVHEA